MRPGQRSVAGSITLWEPLLITLLEGAIEFVGAGSFSAEGVDM